ncbi:MAG: BMP family protein [Clostridia bacterium]|nr:BMP family protein [Clostridia bacterium]
MKKVFTMMVVLLLTLSMVACAAPAAAPAAEPAAADKVYKVAMVCDSSISDGGWGAACYNAMTTAAEAHGWETMYTDSIEVADYVSSIESYCSLGYDMIFLPGNQYSDATKEVAANYPDVKFAVLNGNDQLPTENICSILPNADQIGYLAGGLAGLMTKTNVLGFIGGMELDTTKAKLAGYEKAAKAMNPDVTVLSAYAGSFADTAKGMELATSMIAEKADVFFGDASAVDSGARQAIDNANGTGEINVFDIGQPADILGQNPCIICSVVTDNAGMLGLCMDDVEAGTFGNKVVYGTLENGCLSAGAINTDLVPAEAQEAYLAFVESVKSGEFK